MSEQNDSAACPVCQGPSRYDFSGRDLMFDRPEQYDYHACTRCAAVFLHPMPDAATIAGFYPAKYSVFDESKQVRRISPFKQAVLRRRYGYRQLTPSWIYRLAAALFPSRLDMPSYVPDGRLLDVGCGNGRYLITMRTLGWNVQGVELSENGVSACRAAGLQVHHGDLASAAFADASFDLVTVRHVIEHIPDPHPLMAELGRILKPGGHLIIETPNSDAVGRSLMGVHWYANDVPRHLILFSPANLAQLTAGYGLRQSSHYLKTTPKNILRSLDYALGKGFSKRIGSRWFGRFYVRLARSTGRGDNLHAVFTK